MRDPNFSLHIANFFFLNVSQNSVPGIQILNWFFLFLFIFELGFLKIL